MQKVTNIEFQEGYFIVHRDSGPPTRYAIADMLRSADIPVLTMTQLELLKTLAEVVGILTKTLVEQGTLSESLVDGYDLQFVADTLNDDLDNSWDDT